ncbi:uncharacterized protein [Diadema antillarum]|uniref:uncharacterized protein n=1 Tax=Diadema antillarum TaxID=105358 RepID=UPI003A893000
MDDVSFMDITSDDDDDSFSIPLSIRVQKRLVTSEDGGSSSERVPFIADKRAVFPASSATRKPSSTAWSGLAGFNGGGAGSTVVRERGGPLKEVTSNIAGHPLDITFQSPGVKLNSSLERREQRQQNSFSKRPKAHHSDTATHQGSSLYNEHLPYSPHRADLHMKKYKSAKAGGYSESSSWSGGGNCDEHVHSKAGSQSDIAREANTHRQGYDDHKSACKQLEPGLVFQGSPADFSKSSADFSSPGREDVMLGRKASISGYSPHGTVSSSFVGDVLSPVFGRKSPRKSSSLLDVLLSDDAELPQSGRHHDNMGSIQDGNVTKDQSPGKRGGNSRTLTSPRHISPRPSESNVQGKEHNRSTMRSKLSHDLEQKTVDRGHTDPVWDFLEEAPDFMGEASSAVTQKRFHQSNNRRDELTPSKHNQWPSRHEQWSDSCNISGTSVSDEDYLSPIQLGQTGLPPNTPAKGEAPSISPSGRPRITTTLKSTNGSWKVLDGTPASPSERHLGRGESIERQAASTAQPAGTRWEGERDEDDEEDLPLIKLSSKQHAERMRKLFGSSSEEEDDSEMQDRFQNIISRQGSSGEAASMESRKPFGSDIADEDRHSHRHRTKARHSRNGHLRSLSKSKDGSKYPHNSINHLKSVIFPSSEEGVGTSVRDSRYQTSQDDSCGESAPIDFRKRFYSDIASMRHNSKARHSQNGHLHSLSQSKDGSKYHHNSVKQLKSIIFPSSEEEIGSSARDARNQTSQSGNSQYTSASFQRAPSSPKFSPKKELAERYYKKKRKSDSFDSKFERHTDGHYKKRKKHETNNHVIPTHGDYSGKPRAKTAHQSQPSSSSSVSSYGASSWPSDSGVTSTTRADFHQGHAADRHYDGNRSGSSVAGESSLFPDVERRHAQSPLKLKGKSKTDWWPSSVPKPQAHVSPISKSVDEESRVKPANSRGREDSPSLLSPKPASGHRRLQSVVQVPPVKQDASATPSSSAVDEGPVTLVEDDPNNDDDIIVLDDFSYAASLVNKNSRKRRSHAQGGAKGASSKTSPAGGATDQPLDRDAVSPATLERFKQLDDDEAMARQLQEQFDAEMAQSVHQSEERAGHPPTCPVHSAGFNATYSNQSIHAGTFPSGTPCGQNLPPVPNAPGPNAPGFEDRIPASWDLSFQPASSLVDMHRHHDNGGRRGRGARTQIGSTGAAAAAAAAAAVGAGAGRGGGGSHGGDDFWHLSSVLAFGVDPSGQPPLYMTPPRPPRRRRGRHRRGHVDHSQEIPSGGNDYEALLQLAERLGPAKDKRLTQAAIERLPTFLFREEQHQGTDEEKACPICMEDYEEGAELRRLPCFHGYHKSCIDMWLKKGETPLCPICRVEVRIE